VLPSQLGQDHRSSSSLGPRAPRPLRVPQGARNLAKCTTSEVLFALRAHGGRGARGPSEELEWWAYPALYHSFMKSVLLSTDWRALGKGLRHFICVREFQ
jgi:hypothetical protein